MPKLSKLSDITFESQPAAQPAAAPSVELVNAPQKKPVSMSFSGLFKQGVLCLLPEFKLKSWIADHGMPAPVAALTLKSSADARTRFSSLSRTRVSTWKIKRSLEHL